MKHWGKKLAALVLCAAMVIGLVPGMMQEAKAETHSHSGWTGLLPQPLRPRN